MWMQRINLVQHHHRQFLAAGLLLPHLHLHDHLLACQHLLLLHLDIHVTLIDILSTIQLHCSWFTFNLHWIIGAYRNFDWEEQGLRDTASVECEPIMGVLG